MAIKILGVLLTVLSTGIYGYYCSEYTRKRIEDIEQFKRALLLFSGETAYAGGTLCEVFNDISERVAYPAAGVFKRVAEVLYSKTPESVCTVWESALAEWEGVSFLDKEDIKNIAAFGKSLGFSDKNCQISNVNLTVEYIENKQRELRKKYSDEAKLYKSVSVMAGLLIAVAVF